MAEQDKGRFTRRDFLKVGTAGAAGLAGGAGLLSRAGAEGGAVKRLDSDRQPLCAIPLDRTGPLPTVMGEVDHEKNGFHPSEMLTDFDYGQVSTLPNGQTLREYEFVAIEKEIEVAPGVPFPAWTYNGRVPGPTIRCTEGDRIRIHFSNGSTHPHTIHFHGIHPYEMDGVPGAGPGDIGPGERYTYEFDAEPLGVHLYHCHTFPLAKHIAKGLYGGFIVEPRQGWPPADHELVMVQNGIDIDFDEENEIYAVNTIPFHFMGNPIPIKVGERVRIFLINLLEFDPINSFHLHANFFHYYPTGTSRTPAEFTDTIMQAQAQRGILEFSYKFPGRFMFHAHKTEFAELGWTGLLDVTE